MKLYLRKLFILLGFTLATGTALYSQHIYWTQETYGNARLRKATTTGVLLIDSVAGGNAYSRPRGIDVDPQNNKVYWAEGAFAGADIHRSELNLTSQDSIVKNGSSFRGIALDVTNGFIYWTSTNLINGSKIYRSALNDPNSTVLIGFYSYGTASESLATPKGIALDVAGGKMYWTDDGADRIRRANLDGSNIEDLITTGISAPLGIALDLLRSKMYWTEAGPTGQKIQRANLDGSGITQLIAGLDAPNYIELDPNSNAMYWTEAGASGSIWKSTMDGNSATTVMSALADPAGIVLPHISTPNDITAYPLPGQTTASVSFFVQATGNPVIQTDISGTVITSPHIFPSGTTTVTCTIPGNADGLTASFTVTVVAFPHMVVTPHTLSATLTVGDTTSQTFTISDTGAGDLTFTIAEKPLLVGLLSSARSGALARNGVIRATDFHEKKVVRFDPSDYVSKNLFTGPRMTKNAVSKSAHVRPFSIEKIFTSGFKVLLAAADDGGSFIAGQLLSYPDIGTVDFYDTRSSTPSLAQLQNYDAVVEWTNYPPANPVALGDVLADYVDLGGKVILGTFSFQLGLAGRIMGPTYTPLSASGIDHYSPATLVIVDPSSPIMNGVTNASDIFRDFTGLNAGAHLVAAWSDSENFVAVNGNVAAINSYFGNYFQFTGDVPLILHNTITTLSDKVPWLAEAPLSGTIPGLDSTKITVRFSANGLAAGDYYANLLISSNDSTHLTDTVLAHLHVNDVVLPIQLATFTASAVTAGVKLEWMTVSEINNYGFYVERRPKGMPTFSTVSDLIAGAGTTLEEHQYTWTDQHVPAGNNVYRLRQQDLNGDVSYSHEIVVSGVLGVRDEVAPREFSLKQNYPNPFNPSTTIKFSVENMEHATVKVYNMLGQHVATLFDGIAEPGYYYKFNVDGSQFASGLYIYRIVTDSHIDVKKMLMIK